MAGLNLLKLNVRSSLICFQQTCLPHIRYIRETYELIARNEFWFRTQNGVGTQIKFQAETKALLLQNCIVI